MQAPNPPDPEIARAVRRIEIGLSVMAEANARSAEQRGRLEQTRVEALPSEIERLFAEWQARRAAVYSSLSFAAVIALYVAFRVAESNGGGRFL